MIIAAKIARHLERRAMIDRSTMPTKGNSLAEQDRKRFRRRVVSLGSALQRAMEGETSNPKMARKSGTRIVLAMTRLEIEMGSLYSISGHVNRQELYRETLGVHLAAGTYVRRMVALHLPVDHSNGHVM